MEVHEDGAYSSKYGHDGEVVVEVARATFRAIHRVEGTRDGNREWEDSSQHEVDKLHVVDKRVRDLGGLGNLLGGTNDRLWVLDKVPSALLDREGKQLEGRLEALFGMK